MNTPYKKEYKPGLVRNIVVGKLIGKDGKKTKIPVYKAVETKVLTNPINGYYQSRAVIGEDKDGNTITFPNRSERRRMEKIVANHGYKPMNNRKRKNKRGKNPRGINRKLI